MSSTATAGASSAAASAPNAVPVAYTSRGRMRLPPSNTACRIAPCRRCGDVPGSGSAADSAASTRARHGPKSKSGIRRAEGFGVVRLLRIGEQAHAQFRLFQRGLAFAIQTDAALVGGEGFLEAHLAVFHLLHQLFELVERGFEIGDRGSGGVGHARHGAQCVTAPGQGQCEGGVQRKRASRARSPALGGEVSAPPTASATARSRSYGGRAGSRGLLATPVFPKAWRAVCQ